MSETEVKIKADAPTIATAQPAPQLPTVVKQERKPRQPRDVGPQKYPPKIAKAIVGITGEIGRIQKEGYNEFQKYRYTRWEDISDKLSPLLTKHALVISQSECEAHLVENNEKGSTLRIKYEFFIINEDGDLWGPSYLSATQRLRDQKGITDDKAAVKCATQAEKKFVIQLFKIRSDEGYDDEDHHDALPKKDSRPLYDAFIKEMDAAAKEAIEHGEPSSFLDWGSRNKERKRTYPKDWQEHLTARFNDWRQQIEAALAEAYEHDAETGELQGE